MIKIRKRNKNRKQTNGPSKINEKGPKVHFNDLYIINSKREYSKVNN